MSSESVISVKNVGKSYHIYAQPRDRLKQFLFRGKRQYFREFWALKNVSFEIAKGDVIGILGVNGAGKSTLLQLVCGTLTPTHGEVLVKGRIAALLELGAGFNPEFTGRENVFMSAAIMGLTQDEVSARFEDIVEFSGIRDFIDQPVKTYSSGMYVRLAFSVATHVDPDILVIDEALSVGDGHFARKSFDRIMALKARGCTILFCSHSIYQLEALCQQALWLDQGQVKLFDTAEKVCMAYNQFLGGQESPEARVSSYFGKDQSLVDKTAAGTARINEVAVSVSGAKDSVLQLISLVSTLEVQVRFSSDSQLPCPNVAIVMTDANQNNITSCSNLYDHYELTRDADGHGMVKVSFPEIQLLRGHYWVNVFLLCEQGIHIYDSATHVSQFEVSQPGLEIGVISLKRQWSQQ
ncbi:MAG: ABC transporter ATP-binding protein [Methylococcales bacterium]|jgi:lipopolysaccharide transport system ATP-binding protein|nr:ABC transporter ATP-binding protein [Methylococcales bacterium]MBT4599112.1 ABC transporter ATP-binding protein [Methylococcales bacterium]MBT5437207.1 ABC transporter ATP-binding protein [Methylococcales bacterium]